MIYGLAQLNDNGPRLGTDWVMGGTTKLPKIVRVKDRNWKPFLPVAEKQYTTSSGKWFDTYGCVTFSRNNCCEIVYKFDTGEEINISDRHGVVGSGTIPSIGNYADAVAEFYRTKGFVFEPEYPFDLNADTEQEYYATIPAEVMEKGKKNRDLYFYGYEWVDWSGVDNNVLFEALQYAPIQVSVHTWGPVVNGVYQRVTDTNKPTDHMVTVIAAEQGQWFDIFDHYDQVIKRLAWDYYFGSAMRHEFTKKSMDNTFVKVVKDVNSSAVGYFLPAHSPAMIEQMAALYGKQVPKKANGEIDWDLFIQGTVSFK